MVDFTMSGETNEGRENESFKKTGYSFSQMSTIKCDAIYRVGCLTPQSSLSLHDCCSAQCIDLEALMTYFPSLNCGAKRSNMSDRVYSYNHTVRDSR